MHVPQPSKRFLRAAVSERDDLIAHRRRLEADRARRLNELRDLDEALGAVRERLAILGQMLCDALDDELPPLASSPGESSPPTERAHAEIGARRVLSGPAIREAAVQVLLREPEYIEALHYRRWYDLLLESGFAVAGKDPLAVFLTQLTRSPVVQKGTEAGVYELDRQAPLRLRQRLERLHAEVKELSSGGLPESELASTRARRHELNLSISQTERALEEALRVLRRDGPDGPPADLAVTANGHERAELAGR
jgi:hypothetical protein